MRSRDGKSSLIYQGYKDLLSAFHVHGVQYLVVGGFAVIYPAQPRFTNDMDLFIKADPENAQATYAALAGFGAPLQGIRPEDFTGRNSFFRFGRDPNGFDLLPAISASDLIASKLASGRPQDLADVDAIRKAAASQKPKPPPKTPTELNNPN